MDSLKDYEREIESQENLALSLLEHGKHYSAIVYMLFALTLAVLAVARAISNLPLHNREI